MALKIADSLWPVAHSELSWVIDYGFTLDQLVRSWPELSKPAIEEAIVLASQALHAYYTPGAARAAPA